MSIQTIKIIDPGRRVLATAQVAERGERFSGLADLSSMPVVLRHQFEEYEEIVKSQMFSLLDEAENQIHRLALKVLFEDESEAEFEDLQLYPSTGRLSFKVAKVLPQGAARTFDNRG